MRHIVPISKKNTQRKFKQDSKDNIESDSTICFNINKKVNYTKCRGVRGTVSSGAGGMGAGHAARVHGTEKEGIPGGGPGQ